MAWALGERGSAAVFLDFRRPQPSEAVLVDRHLPGEEFFDGQSVPLARFFQVQETAAHCAQPLPSGG